MSGLNFFRLLSPYKFHFFANHICGICLSPFSAAWKVFHARFLSLFLLIFCLFTHIRAGGHAWPRALLSVHIISSRARKVKLTKKSLALGNICEEVHSDAICVPEHIKLTESRFAFLESNACVNFSGGGGVCISNALSINRNRRVFRRKRFWCIRTATHVRLRFPRAPACAYAWCVYDYEKLCVSYAKRHLGIASKTGAGAWHAAAITTPYGLLHDRSICSAPTYATVLSNYTRYIRAFGACVNWISVREAFQAGSSAEFLFLQALWWINFGFLCCRNTWHMDLFNA